MSRRKRAALIDDPPSDVAIPAVDAFGDVPPQREGARVAVLVTFLAGFWLILNQGGGTDLAQAPAYFFIAFWWIIAALGAWRIHRNGNRLWAAMSPGMRSYTVALLVTMLLNLSSSQLYAPQGQLMMVALLGWLKWGGVLLAGVVLAVWLSKDTRGVVPVVLQIFLIHGVLVAIWGLADYLQGGASEPLSGVFSWHNPAGGYFALLIPLATARALGDRRPSAAAMSAGSAIILFAALAATLSRGAWLCALIGLFYLIIVMAVQKVLVPWRIGVVIGLIVLAVALPFVIGGPLTPIRDRLVSLTAQRDFSVEGRGNFYGTAVDLFRDGPLDEGMAIFGGGMDTYRYLSPRQQTDARFYASDPHSVFFGFLAELGVPGILWYLIAWGWWGWIQWGSGLFRRADSAAEDSALPILVDDPWPGWRIDACGLSAGLLTGWLHWTIDFDHTFWLITWTALSFAAILIVCMRTRYGLRAPVDIGNIVPEAVPKIAVSQRVKLKELQLSQLMGNIAVIVLAVGSLSCVMFAMSRIFYDQGQAAFDRFQPPTIDRRTRPQAGDSRHLIASRNAYTTAAILWPWDGSAWRGASLAQLWLADRALPIDSNEATLHAKMARSSAQNAAENAKYDARNWMHLARVIQLEEALGLVKSAEAAEDIAFALAIAMEADPINNPQVYSLLAQAVAAGPESEPRDETVILTVDRFARYFPPDKITEYSKTRLDRGWTELPLHYLMIWPLYLRALESDGDRDGFAKAAITAREQLYPAARESEFIPKEVIEPLITRVEEAITGKAPDIPTPPTSDTSSL